MRSLLARELLFITGKGGVGKTTVSAALGLLASSRGLRTMLVELGEQTRMAELFGRPAGPAGTALALAPGLSAVTIDPDRALLEWLQSVGGRVSGRVLASSSTFQYFAAAAPGAQELVSMVKIWQLTRGSRAGEADLVIVDGPATGHALGLLRSPATFGAIARVGPIASQTEQVRELLADPARAAFVAVALGTDMAVTETLELQQGIRGALGRELSSVIVNGVLPRRFSGAELERIETLEPDGQHGGAVAAAVHAARAIEIRARTQHAQVARLRRRGLDTLTVSFSWADRVDIEAVRHIAEQLGRRIDG